mgnify:CR=1 FL=1
MGEQPHRPSEEGAPERKPEQLQKWEYKMLSFSWGSVPKGALGLSKHIVMQDGQEIKLSQGMTLKEKVTEVLNHLGENGWNCIGMTHDDQPGSTAVRDFIFKRPL